MKVDCDSPRTEVGFPVPYIARVMKVLPTRRRWQQIQHILPGDKIHTQKKPKIIATEGIGNPD